MKLDKIKTWKRLKSKPTITQNGATKTANICAQSTANTIKNTATIRAHMN